MEIPEKVIRVGQLALKRGVFRLLQATKAKDLRPFAREVFEILTGSKLDPFPLLTVPQGNAEPAP